MCVYLVHSNAFRASWVSARLWDVFRATNLVCSTTTAPTEYPRGQRIRKAAQSDQGTPVLLRSFYTNLIHSLDRTLSQIISRQIPTRLVSKEADGWCSCWLILSVALSGDAQTVKLSKYLPTLPETHSIAVFVGAMARGQVHLLARYK